jgi:hypothetical protein
MNHTAMFELKSTGTVLEAAGLHDALLHSVTFDWAAAEVSMELALLGTIHAVLAFHSITSIMLPRNQPWGPSSAINEAKTLPSGEYEIEMQSGDTLRFTASSWSLSISASPSKTSFTLISSKSAIQLQI